MQIYGRHSCLERLQQEELPERFEFFGPEILDGFLEGVLPHVKLDDLQVVQDLHNLLQPAVLVNQMVLLTSAHSPRRENAHQDNNSETEETCK